MSLSHGRDVIKSFATRMPSDAGVYRMLNDKGEAIYIGKARALSKRVISYTRTDALPLRLQRMVSGTVDMTFTVTSSEREALLLESSLIKIHRPRYNVLLLDDKSFPYVVIDTTHPFPSLGKHRGTRDKNKLYFGPFANADAVNKTMIDLQRGFKLRNCTDSTFAARKRPCLQYHIKRCTAPCVGLVDGATYADQVRQTKEFLQGDVGALQKNLQTEMQTASDAMNFEQAASLRDRLQAMAHVQSRNEAVNTHGIVDADVFVLARLGSSSAVSVFFIRNHRNHGHTTFFPRHDEEVEDSTIIANCIAQFYTARPPAPIILVSDIPEEVEILQAALPKTQIICPQRGGKAVFIDWARQTAQANLATHISQTRVNSEIMDGLQTLAGMATRPERIEIYDNSHIQGAFKVGAYVVYTPEGFAKKEYRQYNITETDVGDDFAMMREVLARRIKRINEGGVAPDLMLIDGGKGQLSQVIQMFAAHWPQGQGMPTIIAVAKGEDRHAGREVLYFPDGREERLAHGDPVLHFIQRLRDEAHRFVIGRHRAKRTKTIEINQLDDIPNVGAARKKALLLHFGSAKAVRSASIKDIQAVQGVSATLAEQIYKYFHE